MATQVAKNEKKLPAGAIINGSKPKTNAPPLPGVCEEADKKAVELGTLKADGGAAKFNLALYIDESGATKRFERPYCSRMIDTFARATQKRMGRPVRGLSKSSADKDMIYMGGFYDLGAKPYGRAMLQRIDVLARETGNAFTRGCSMIAAIKRAGKTIDDDALRACAKKKSLDLGESYIAEAVRVEKRAADIRKIENRDDEKHESLAVAAALEAYAKVLRAEAKKLDA